MNKVNEASVTTSGSDLERPVMRIDLQYCHGDEGRAYYTKGHIPLDDFMAEVRKNVDDDDIILREEPCHCWMRVCRNFEEDTPILVEAVPNSRGAFAATWILTAICYSTPPI